MKLSINVIPKDAAEAQLILAALAPFPIEEGVTGDAPSAKGKRPTKAEKVAAAAPPVAAPPVAAAPPAAPPVAAPPVAAPPVAAPPGVPADREAFIGMLNTFVMTHPHGEAYAGQLVAHHLAAYQASIASELDPAYYPAFIQAINTPPAV